MHMLAACSACRHQYSNLRFALLEKIIDTFAKDGIGGIDVKGLIVELEKTSKIELDFTNEAANLERFLANNAQRPGIEVPKCYRSLTNEAILTEDFVIGYEVGNTAFLNTLDDEERDRIAALVADNFASQVLIDGFYHADPHSGNVLIKEPEPGMQAIEESQAVASDASEDEAAVTAATDEAASEDKLPLPEHGIEWIDFGMMGLLSAQQRQILLDLVTSVIMQDAYALKRTVLKAAKPMGDIDHGALLEMCEDMCGQYTGTDFGDFNLGDLLSSITGGLQEQSYKIEPFLTNLSRGIIAAEGTIKALSPRINMLNYFIDKVDIGPAAGLDIDFNNLDDDDIEKLKGPIAMELMKFLDSSSRASAKTAESLDMLEKGQIRVSTDFDFEQRGLDSVKEMMMFVVQALMIITLFLGSCILCTVPPNAMEGTSLPAVFPIMGFVGYVVSLWLTFFLYRKVKKSK